MNRFRGKVFGNYLKILDSGCIVKESRELLTLDPKLWIWESIARGLQDTRAPIRSNRSN